MRLTRHGQSFWCTTQGRVSCHAWLWRTQGMQVQDLHNRFAILTCIIHGARVTTGGTH